MGLGRQSDMSTSYIERSIGTARNMARIFGQPPILMTLLLSMQRGYCVPRKFNFNNVIDNISSSNTCQTSMTKHASYFC